jgi:hypothetical protein
MPEPRDTRPEAQRVLDDLVRRMTPEQKLARVVELQEAVEAFARGGIRARHPRADGREVELRLGALKYGRELMVAAFGWDPGVEGW